MTGRARKTRRARMTGRDRSSMRDRMIGRARKARWARRTGRARSCFILICIDWAESERNKIQTKERRGREREGGATRSASISRKSPLILADK